MKQLLMVILASFSVVSNAQVDSLVRTVKGGSVSGYWRNFYMYNDNEGGYQDWYALATGGLLKYETQSYKGLKFGIGYYASYNTGLDNVEMLDEGSNRPSRYVSGLFDVENLSKREIHILGELYLNYRNKGHELKFGRMKLKTPFLNPEDGRMIPTLEQGLWYKNSSLKKVKIQAGWLTHIAPRSSSRWYSVQESIGVYPVGKGVDGTNSGYKNNLNSKGLGVFTLAYKSDQWGVQVWDYYLENIYNSIYGLAYFEVKKEQFTWKASGQYLFQNQLNDGGNAALNQSYFQDKQASVYGVQLKVSTKSNISISGNYNYISDEGRFLFPREWGRETLFTFQKRERLEGVANTNAWLFDIAKEWQKEDGRSIKVVLGYGQYLRPETTSFDLNKYAMPANDQLNVDLFYNFGGSLKGLGLEYLISYKRALGKTNDNPNFIINKVNMWNHNVVMNYKF